LAGGAGFADYSPVEAGAGGRFMSQVGIGTSAKLRKTTWQELHVALMPESLTNAIAHFNYNQFRRGMAADDGILQRGIHLFYWTLNSHSYSQQEPQQVTK
jgi:hypothetical protein